MHEITPCWKKETKLTTCVVFYNDSLYILYFNFTRIKSRRGRCIFDVFYWRTTHPYHDASADPPDSSIPFRSVVSSSSSLPHVPSSKYGYFLEEVKAGKTRTIKKFVFAFFRRGVAVNRLGLDLVVHDGVAGWSAGHEGGEEGSVLRGVGRVDQQPSREPEVGDEGGQQQEPGDESVVSGEEEEEGGVEDVSDTGEPHGHSEVAGEDSPHADAPSKHDHEHASED